MKSMCAEVLHNVLQGSSKEATTSGGPSISYDELREAVNRVTNSTVSPSSKDPALMEVFPEGYEAPSAAGMLHPPLSALPWLVTHVQC